MTTLQNAGRYYTTTAAGRKLGVDGSLISQEIREGQLEAIKVNIKGVPCGKTGFLYLISEEALLGSAVAVRQRRRQSAETAEQGKALLRGAHRAVTASGVQEVSSLRREVKDLRDMVSELVDSVRASMPATQPGSAQPAGYLTKEDVDG